MSDLAGVGDADQYAIGYTYDLSKRTNLYTSYGYTKNDPGSAVGIAVASPPPAPGGDPSVFNVGVRHRF
jgi:predicted porin